jgi:sialic acid synthase SpsE
MNDFKDSFFVKNKKIHSSEKTYIVAEIGLNHNNDLEIGKRTIEAAKNSGVDAVKFQTYKTENFIDEKNTECKFLFDIFKKYELSEKFHIEFQKTAHDLGLDFFSTPLDVISVDFLNSLNVPVFKIASGDIVNSELLEAVSRTKKPIFLSTGAAELFEITRALEFLHSNSVEELALFYCVSLYPTPIQELNLKTISLFREIFKGPLGFSDHSAGHLATSLSMAFDVSIIEKHFTLDKSLDGPDHTISLDPKEMSELVQNVEIAKQMVGFPRKRPSKQEREGRFFGRRSLYINEQNRPISLRPAIHLKDSSYFDSWEFIKWKNKTVS